LINQTHAWDLFLPISATEKQWFEAIDRILSIGEILSLPATKINAS
jgi:hypothetical protein